jgi:formylglycine-generating enzyme required for sulfatase activity
VLFETLLAQILAQSAASGLPAPVSPPARPAFTCPSGMLPVEGVHYENIQRLCTDLRGKNCFSFVPGLVAREPRETVVRTCMDQYEWPNRAGQDPTVMVRFVEAEALCARAGKRLCSEFEWEMACEGPETRPFPYGYRNDKNACNTGKPYKGISEKKLNSSSAEVRDAETRRLWQGAPSGSFPACVSSFGIADLTGNIEEWVTTKRPEWPHPSSLKGGFWSKPWAGCRGTNDSHGPMFRFYEVGFRCCKDPAP